MLIGVDKTFLKKPKMLFTKEADITLQAQACDATVNKRKTCCERISEVK
jgi:hypothetical protein